MLYILVLKGTMSEAELHIIRARLQGGITNKARRGELKIRLPIGFVYDENERVILDPDQQIQNSIKTLFNIFLRTGTACATVKHFRKEHLKFPRKPNSGPGKGDVVWDQLEHTRVLQILHNPRYAGAFVFGRTKTRKDIEGKTTTKKIKEDQWEVMIPNTHPEYISWDAYIANKKILQENAQAYGVDRRKSPAREGNALLQGIVICGVCGKRMTVRYYKAVNSITPQYICQRDGIKNAGKICQSIPGARIDDIIGTQLQEMVNPMNLEISLTVEAEFNVRIHETDKLRKQEIERMQYETELARRRYLRVDPDNRLVANTLEADWNDKLRCYQLCLEDYEKKFTIEKKQLDDQKKAEIRELSRDFTKVWNNTKVPHRDRKRLIRLLIEDVTLFREEKINIHIRFKGGTTKTIDISKPQVCWELKKATSEVIEVIDKLLENHTDGEIAKKLNEQCLISGWGKAFTPKIILRLKRNYNLKSFYERLRSRGLLNAEEMGKILDIKPSVVKSWRQKGILTGVPYTDRPDFLYENIGDKLPVKGTRKCQRISGKLKVITNNAMEVQYAT